MSTDITFFKLPNISQYSCIESVVQKVTELNQDCNLETRITQIGLIALAEVAAIFELGIQFIQLNAEIFGDLCRFTFNETDKIGTFFWKSLEISQFFFGLIPFLIGSNLDFKSLEPLLDSKESKTAKDAQIESLQHEISELRQAVSTKEEELAMQSSVKKVVDILKNYENFLDPKKSLFERFELENGDIEGLIRAAENLLFWTNPENHLFLLSRELTEEESAKSNQVQSYFKTLITLYRSYEKIYHHDVIQYFANFTDGNLFDFENIMELHSHGDNLHRKIFFVFKKLFQIHLSIEEIAEKEIIEEQDRESVLLFSDFLERYYENFDMYLRMHHPDIQLHSNKPIQLKKEHIEKYFHTKIEAKVLVEKLLHKLDLLSKRPLPYASEANFCMTKSLRKCLEGMQTE